MITSNISLDGSFKCFPNFLGIRVNSFEAHCWWNINIIKTPFVSIFPNLPKSSNKNCISRDISILTIGVSGFSINYNPIVKGSPERVSNPVVVTNRGLHVFGFGHSRNRWLKLSELVLQWGQALERLIFLLAFNRFDGNLSCKMSHKF